jgi:hypothetical protein
MKKPNMPTRREALFVGGLAGLGVTLPRLLSIEARAQTTAVHRRRPRAKSCILFFMEGGPSHIDLWDMKPKASEQIRGIYKPIVTSLPGFHVCDQLPLWAPIMRHMSVIRSVSHKIVDHNASSYFSLTGQYPMRGGQLIRGPSRDNAPPIGAVLAKLRPTGQPLPDFVHIPKRMFNCGSYIPGQLAGFLGESHDPFITGDPSHPDFQVAGLSPLPGLPPARLRNRRSLLDEVRHLDRIGESASGLSRYYERAFALVTSEQARQAFDLSAEPEAIRRRYGADSEGTKDGGKLAHLGYSMLLARRLIEAGVRLVTVWAGRQAFDTHREHFSTLTKSLCPPLNRAFSALIEDLADRSLLDETLVVATSEFGRTPQLGQITSSAGATPDGRDHWPQCYSTFLAGGGMKAGYVYGASDSQAAFPHENPVTPIDVAATVYAAMGVDPQTRISDRLNRPHTLADGEPIADVLA